MKRKWLKTTVILVTALLAFPLLSKADGLADNIHGLQGTMNNVTKKCCPCAKTLSAWAQEYVLALDITLVQEAGNAFFSSADTAYIFILIIGIAGCFCVPLVAGYIVRTTVISTIVQQVNTLMLQSGTSASNIIYAPVQPCMKR